MGGPLELERSVRGMPSTEVQSDPEKMEAVR